MSESATMETPSAAAPDAADIVAEMNDTAATNATGTKIPATPEGMMVAYGSLVIMALIPIFLGSFRSVDSQREQKENHVGLG